LAIIGTLAALATLAVDIATTVHAIKEITKKGNSREIAKVGQALERQLRTLTASELRRKRKKSMSAAKARRDPRGRFL